MADELKPCPFCGSAEHLSISSCGVLTTDMPSRPHRVMCRHIDHDEVTGPVAYGRHQAIAAWNRRTLPTLPDDLEGLCERGLRKAKVRPAFGSAGISSDGTSTSFIIDDGMGYANPDGPELVAAIRTLSAELAATRGAIDNPNVVSTLILSRQCSEIEALKAMIGEAADRIADMLEGDDAQAWDEARATLAKLRSAQS